MTQQAENPVVTKTPAVVPLYLGFKMKPEVAALLHRVSYETGRTKADLTSEAILLAHGEAS